MYISITGLRLNSPWNAPKFWWHAIGSMRQAKAADGNLFAQARTINGIHHTVSAWRDVAAMKAYLSSGPHLAALKTYRKIATGKTLGFEAETIPDWSEVHALWLRDARVV
jgi:hypothetical protein